MCLSIQNVIMLAYYIILSVYILTVLNIQFSSCVLYSVKTTDIICFLPESFRFGTLSH